MASQPRRERRFTQGKSAGGTSPAASNPARHTVAGIEGVDEPVERQRLLFQIEQMHSSSSMAAQRSSKSLVGRAGVHPAHAQAPARVALRVRHAAGGFAAARLAPQGTPAFGTQRAAVAAFQCQAQMLQQRRIGTDKKRASVGSGARPMSSANCFMGPMAAAPARARQKADESTNNMNGVNNKAPHHKWLQPGQSGQF